MWNRFSKFADKHPWWAMFIMIFTMSTVALSIMWVFKICSTLPITLEDVKNAQYVLYTSDGEMKAVNAETIVDMENGYQYRIFEINGQYVCAPAINEDGTVYKTVE